MVRKCRGATAEVAAIDMAATAGVRTRARALTMTAAPANSDGTEKRRKIGSDFNFAENSTCMQVRIEAERHLTAVSPQPEVYPRCSDDEASDVVSCCSSHLSSQTEKDKLKFADLERHEDGSAEIDTSTSHLRRERREKASSSSEVEKDSDGMDSVGATLSERRSKDEFRTPRDTDDLHVCPKVVNQKCTKPTDPEIEEFFTVAEAENLQQLQHFKKKYNFDFAKEEPLEGRFQWCRFEHEDKCK